MKPAIPRALQLFLRRTYVQTQRAYYSHVWPIDPSSAQPPQGWSGWPDGKQFALVLTHDVETAYGQDRCRDIMSMEMQLGFRSSFNFVPERYNVSAQLRGDLTRNGFEVGVHGLYHDGKYFTSRKIFLERAIKINRYMREWEVVGYRSPSMLCNLEWMHDMHIEYDSSTFDTDPFEPQPDGMRTIFPFWVSRSGSREGYVELPYTLPQDHALFVIMREKSVAIWKQKLDWIAMNGGMALLITHPDYMRFDGSYLNHDEYFAEHYREFLEYVIQRYSGQYWPVLPREMARYWRQRTISK